MDTVINVLTGTLNLLSHGIPGLIVAGLTMFFILLGLIRRDTGLLIFAALFFIPFAYSMGAWAGLKIFVRLMPLFLLGSAYAIEKNEPIFAWALPMPAAGYLIYILFSIIASGL
jgi:hypothetical protein